MTLSNSLRENILEAWQSVKGNRLRTFLTATIIAIGLMALVGILTSIDAIKGSLNNTFSSMGANSFTIRNKGIGIRIGGEGKEAKRHKPITYREAVAFKESFNFPATVSINTSVTGNATLKYGSKKTNPNIPVTGADENYLKTGGYALSLGRNFSSADIDYGASVVIIGQEIRKTLFENANPIDRSILIGNDKFRVVGLLKPKGSGSGFGGDKTCIIPLVKARELISSNNPSYTITVMSAGPSTAEATIGEATAVFRNVRGLRAGDEDSFEVTKSDALVKTLLENIKYVTMAAIVIAFVTLVGASIGLMNIMLVSVTERTREIGIRKAIGGTPSAIRQQFLLEAIVICLLGGMAGIILGILIGNLVAVLLGASFIIPWAWILLGLVLCVTVGILSGSYPAAKASRLDPVEALRYE